MITDDIKSLYDKQGYVIVPGLIPAEFDTPLREATGRVISKTRSGGWSHRRTVGKQFPPFDNNNPDSWGVQHLMHPDLGEPIFAEWYNSEALVQAICRLLDCGEDKLQMELFNLLINPESHEFALRWHRDDVREAASEDEERQALAVWHHGAQWNTALYEDSCLYVVPGSHKRPRDNAQRALSSTSEPPKNPFDMPGSLQVVLKEGETVFYNSNILHCAAYDPTVKRATLHACMGEISGGSTRARNILQHGLSWMKEARFKNTLREGRSRDMLERLVRMQEGFKESEIEYSQVG